ADDMRFAAACKAYEHVVRAFLQERIETFIQQLIEETTIKNRSGTLGERYELFTRSMQTRYKDSLVLTQDDLRAIPVHLQYQERWDGEQELTSLFCQPDRTRLKPT